MSRTVKPHRVTRNLKASERRKLEDILSESVIKKKGAISKPNSIDVYNSSKGKIRVYSPEQIMELKVLINQVNATNKSRNESRRKQISRMKWKSFLLGITKK